jgi:hypothetical protein
MPDDYTRFIILWLTEELGELTKKQQELVSTLELPQIERFTYSNRGFPGCPLKKP